MENLEAAHKKLKNVLNAFHTICIKHNLKYWSLGGTLIGAVRHKGFVPWDGDVDVAMTSDDYNVFEKHVQDELPSTMFFFGKSEPGLAKIRDLYSSYSDHEDGVKHHGLQLDIFIYDIKHIQDVKKIVSIEKWLVDYKENEYEYDSIFPVQLTKFEDIEVYIPNKIKEVCEYSYGGYPPPFPKNQTCHEGKIDPVNPAQYYPVVFKDIYFRKTQQWFSEKATDNSIALHQMSGWNYLTQEKWDTLCSHVVKDVKLKDIETMFDAGCGCGGLFQYVKKFNKTIQLYGCDINTAVVEKCKQGFPEAHVQIGDITNLHTYESNTFDFVSSISSVSYLYTLGDVKRATNEFLRIVKPGGKVHICINTDTMETLKSFSILIPKSFWSKQNFDVANITIEDIPLEEFANRYSVFITKHAKNKSIFDISELQRFHDTHN